MSNIELEYVDVKENKNYEALIESIVDKCFQVEKMEYTNLYLNVILATPEYIRKANKEYRNIDKATDVLSFPMFEKEEVDSLIKRTNKEKKKEEIRDVLGDIIISIEKVKEQAVEYGHSFERELAYMVVHGFYHVMGYDHIEEEDKIEMRKKEEYVLNILNITRDKA